MRIRAVLPALCVTLAAGAIVGPAPAAAQAPVPSLDAVDSLIAAGLYDDARATLDRWWSAREAFQVPGSDRARGLVLRARLKPDPAAAEEDYLAVILGYPTSPVAPEALLRLGQGLLASGQAVRAAGYLRRLTADYPGRPQRTLGMLWLARAENAAHRPAAACAAAREGLLDAAQDPGLAAMLRLEEAASCAIGDGGRDAVTAERPPVVTAAAPPAPPAETGRYAVQSGAFRYTEGADALLARLRDAGYDARAVLVPGSTLVRIRVGHFATADEAARLVREIRADGFEAVVVSDADEERRP